jgi:branched-chain amino acid aminotransferase
MLNADGYVSECTGDNVFLIKENEVITPPPSAGVLVGVTRAAVMEIVRTKTKLRMREKLFRPAELFRADEIFFTGTAAEVIPVTRVDRRRIGNGKPGPKSALLISLFKQLIARETGHR